MSLSTLSRMRKRVHSKPDDPDNEGSRRKRQRVSSISSDLRRSLLGESFVITSSEGLHRSNSFVVADDASDRSIHLPRTMSSSIAFNSASPSRASSPMVFTGGSERGSAYIDESGLALMRSVSVSSVRSSTPPSQAYPDISAKYHLRNTKITIDFSPPTTTSNSNGNRNDTNNPPQIATHLLSCSTQNVLFFCRGNRVHFKNLNANNGEEIGQLCKLQEDRGDLRVIECGGNDVGDIVALGTTKGIVQIWDVRAKKMKMSWSTKGVSVIRWNGPVLTLGGLKGTIRHYDTRVEPKSKMKDQAPKLTRHQARISSLAWNVTGKVLASGDESGMVYCWEQGKKVPLDVGEFVQRRKKIQHGSAIAAVAWCPWHPKLLASGDSKGLLRLWNVEPNSTSSDGLTPGTLDLGAAITGLHFSQHVKEILTTHGATVTDPAQPDNTTRPKVSVSNSIAVHSLPSLRHVNSIRVMDKRIRNSVMNALGTKIVLELPEDNKLGICDVWSKKRELKRHSSLLDSVIR